MPWVPGSEPVTFSEPLQPRGAGKELDPVSLAGSSEAFCVAGLERGGLLEPLFAPARGEHLDDAGGGGFGVPHGVEDASRLERPRAWTCRGRLLTDEDADLAGQDVDPDIVLVGVRGDQRAGRDGLLEHGHDAAGLLGAHAYRDIESAAELVAFARADEERHGSSSNTLREGRSSQNRGGVIPAFMSFDKTVIHYEHVGSGEPVMLLHSFPFDSRVWHSTGVADAITAAADRSSPLTGAAAVARLGRMIRARTRTTRAPATSPA